jgi:hypothetical protein
MVTIDKEFMWFLGLWEGDNNDNEYYLGIGNTSLPIIRRALEFLNKFLGKEEIFVYIEIPQNNSKESTKIIESQLIEYCKSILTRKTQRKKTFITVKVYSVTLKEIFLRLREIVIEKIYELNNEMKASYVQGFFDAEGSVNLSNKIAEFYQKNTGISKLLLIKDLLNQLGIKTSKIYTHSKNRQDMLLFQVLRGKNKENIKKFIEIISSNVKSKFEKMEIIKSPSSTPNGSKEIVKYINK